MNTTIKLYRLPEVLGLTGLSRSSIYRLMKNNEFPQAVKLSARAIAWRSTDLADWFESREASK